ncbi:lipid-A-disaccharide synthase [Pedobacter aquae]|uniref:Lipid-A-disaccharide synthase n=1 Tax=Pedobacter aquae TaxID=2605747 RepID=A0A5C0VJ57_9SPHI|nr:lipid-A-disaccharide synthase [Pedobacter aquae]QEK51731.1 lipid-A-disaccharide synthase [Pedobacter aquae]
MRYYIVAGEASGDLHGANLMKALKNLDAEAEFRFFGGDLMQAQGGTLVKHYADMAFMGFLEVLMNLRAVLKNISFCKQDVLAYQPDVLILVDFPGFNLKIADFAKKHNIKVYYYISPKVWAWNQKRVLKIKKVVDKMFCILPFEVDFYKEWGMEVDYVGNPLLDAIAAFTPQDDFLASYKLGDKKIIALLPGSRKQELQYLLPDMLAVADKLPDYQFVIAGAPSFNQEHYDSFLNGRNIPVVFGATYDLLHHAHAALVTSGTATLETALFKVPEVVLYKGGKISITIARMLVKIRFISLVNLIMDKEVVKELIQEDCNAAQILKELKPLLEGEKRVLQLQQYQLLADKMGLPGASEKTAKLIYEYLNR